MTYFLNISLNGGLDFTSFKAKVMKQNNSTKIAMKNFILIYKLINKMNFPTNFENKKIGVHLTYRQIINYFYLIL